MSKTEEMFFYMEKIYSDFFHKLISNEEDLSRYVDSLYASDIYSEEDLNHIFGVLSKEGLLACHYADNRAWVSQITFKGKHYFDDEKHSEKPRLIELIEQIPEVEKAFHTIDGSRGVPTFDVIYDTQIFQDWIQELQYELQNLSTIYEEDYLKKTIEMVEHPFNGWNDRKDFTAIKGRLKVIERNQTKYFLSNLRPKIDMNVRKKPLIFISHSSKNITQVRLLVELLRALNLQPQQDVFCSSLPGYDIPLATEDRIFDFLRNTFLNYDIHVFFIHSHEYYSSPVCLNEMGAAWALKTTQTSFLLPGFDFEDMRGVINKDYPAVKLDHDILEVKDKLNQVRRTLEKEFALLSVHDTIWEQARDKFIDGINQIG